MSIKDYSLDTGLSVNKIIKKLKELGFNYKSEEDILDDECIILLDNSLTNEEENINEELINKYEMEDRAEEAASRYNINLDEPKENKVKFKKKDSKPDNKDLLV